MPTKKEVKLQLRLYPEKDEQHRRALAWLKQQKGDGASYGDLVARAICSLIDREKHEEAEERMRQVVREEIRANLQNAAVTTTSSIPSPAESKKPAEGSLRKAKGFMSGMGFG